MRKLAFLLLLMPLLFACKDDNPNGPDIPSNLNVLNLDAANFDAPLLPAQTYISAARFSPSRLAPHVGDDLVSVYYYFKELPQSAKLNIYTSASGSAPDSLIYQADLTGYQGFSWNSHTLSAPITIGTDALWIGIQYTQISSQRILGCDPGPAVIDGDWHWDGADSTWTPLNQRTNGVLDINWNIRAAIDPN